MSIWGDGCRAPYQYAGDILVLRTREERREALAAVPELWRAMVREMVEDEARLLHAWQRRIDEGRVAPDRVPQSVRDALARLKT